MMFAFCLLRRLQERSLSRTELERVSQGASTLSISKNEQFGRCLQEDCNQQGMLRCRGRSWILEKVCVVEEESRT
jgi:hypothetical protein